MNYTRLLQDAWSITWRYRFLWILALFAGAGSGSCSGPGFNFSFNFPASGNRSGRTESPAITFDDVIRWLAGNATLVIAVVAGLVLLGLIFFIISLIAQGGMAQATVDLASGRPSSLRSAIRAGRRLLWRFFGLWLVLTVAWLAISLTIFALFALGVAIFSIAGDVTRVTMIVIGVLFLLLAVPVAIVLSIPLSVVVTYAQRAIVVQDVGPLAALWSGLILLSTYFGRSLLIWLISVGVGIVAGIAFFVVALAVFVPLGALGVALYLGLGLHALTIAYIVVAGLIAVAIVWLLSAIINTYTWSYWTIAYLRLAQ